MPSKNFTIMRTALLAIVLVFTAKSALCGNILIPGFETLNLKAGQLEQKVMFCNPEENSCDFRITLLLEDGQAIWTSELIPPGKTLTVIELNRELERGKYRNAVMKYECFADDGSMQLNGAQIRLNIQVK